MAMLSGYPREIFVATGAGGSVWGCPIDGIDNCRWIAKPADGKDRNLPTLVASSTTLYTK